METNFLMLFFFLLLNFAISYWNAYVAGRFWTETKIIGGWQRFTTWCAVIMSACGFTWVYLTILTIVAVATQKLTPEQGQAMFNLGYLIIILPVLGSGMGIWLDSLIQAYRQRNFGSVAVASWNTYAQLRNTWDAASYAPSAFKSVVDAFTPKGKNKDGAAAALMLALVILALCGGALTTAAIVRWADRKVAIDVVGARA